METKGGLSVECGESGINLYILCIYIHTLMVKRIVNMTIDHDDLEKYKEILAHNPRLCGNVSKAIGEHIKQVIQEDDESEKKDDVQIDPLQKILTYYIFVDRQNYKKFQQWDEPTLYEFVTKTREASKSAENIYKLRFGQNIYLQDRLISDRKIEGLEK